MVTDKEMIYILYVLFNSIFCLLFYYLYYAIMCFGMSFVSVYIMFNNQIEFIHHVVLCPVLLHGHVVT